MRINHLKGIKRLVIKIGTKSITTDLKIDLKKIKKIVSEISDLHKKKFEIILVSSGAITSGIGELNLNKRPNDIPEKQAFASVGQIALISHYHNLFRKDNITIGQVLLTESDLKDRVKYLNARNTLLTLIEKYKVIPIINENDVVGVEEIIFGDNDVLSALIANLIDADLLILLTNTHGFYMTKNGKMELVHEISSLTDEMFTAAGQSEDEFSTGGMKSKLQAVKIANQSGIPAVIAYNNEKEVLKKIIIGEKIGSFFYPQEKGLSHKKRWIAFSVAPKGRLIIDDGAKDAIIKKNKSLLAGGIINIDGKFAKGDPVDICDKQKQTIARGLVNYNSEAIDKIKGKKSSEIQKICDDKFYEEVIHKDNMVIY